MNNQEIFDIVTRHLLTQNEKSRRGENDEGTSPDQCLYRGPRGLMCAAGCLISDAAYTPELENKLSDHFDVVDAIESSGWVIEESTTIQLIRSLQRVHDQDMVDHWKPNLKAVADQFNLNWNF